MTKPDSRDTEGIDVAREIRRAATDQVAAAIEAELLGADSHDNRRDQTGEDTDALDAALQEEQNRRRLEGKQVAGNVPPLPVSPPPSEDSRTHARDVTKRLQAEGRWFGQAETTRDGLMAEAKAGGMTKAQAQAWTYSELDRMYPPVQVETRTSAVDTKGLTSEFPLRSGISGEDSGSIQGLSLLPDSWPTLPANASLPAEVAWVQANRLRVVKERPGQATRVDLELSLSPAPSWAALSWLETSIRSYAKFMDVAAKVSGADSDEGAVMKRERKSVDEVKALLASMEEATGACPHCGRSG